MNSLEQSVPAKSPWRYLGRQLKSRTVSPFENPVFLFFFILAIIGGSAIGIWIELVRSIQISGHVELADLFYPIITFYTAIAGPSSIQLGLNRVKKSDTVMAAFAWFVFGISVASAILLSVFFDKFQVHAFILSVCFGLGSIWIWWVCNAYNPDLASVYRDGAIGGPTDRQLSGDLQGFEEN